MNNEIILQITVHPNCKLTVLDNYEYACDEHGNSVNMIDYKSIETIIYDNEIIKSNTKFTDFENPSVTTTLSEFALIFDGWHIYYKFLIPKLSHFCENVDDCNEVYLNNQFYYHENKIYKYDGEYRGDIDELLNDSSEVSIDNLISAHTNNSLGSHIWSCEKNIFTICGLTKRFVELHKTIISEQCTCKNIDHLIDMRDFLLSTIYVLDYLKDLNNFAEAQKILNNVIGCFNTTKSCNCHE